MKGQAGRPCIHYSPSTREWFMESDDAKVKRRWILAHEDAIQVTNAYEVSDPRLIEHLRKHQFYPSDL